MLGLVITQSGPELVTSSVSVAAVYLTSHALFEVKPAQILPKSIGVFAASEANDGKSSESLSQLRGNYIY